MNETPPTAENAAETATETPAAPARRWRTLSAQDRRVAGVLVEKAKTTPDAYPMSVNALCAGCNQKSNRHPLMNLEPDAVEESLDRLRHLGAAAEVQGSGRVPRYRHYLYEWFGVDKVEMAVMVELLLRGAQTEGELRGRAARMEPIADLAALRPVLESLKAKQLIVSLTPPGRGHVVSHALYEPREMDKLRAQFAGAASAAADEQDDDMPSSPPPRVAATTPATPAAAAPSNGPSSAELESLRDEFSQLREEVATLTAQLHDCRDELDRLKSQLGV